jgi:solute carrier family 25 citrate transporter 1
VFGLVLLRFWEQLPPLGFYATGKQIVKKETPLGLYKGLGAVIGGIVSPCLFRSSVRSWMRGKLTD